MSGDAERVSRAWEAFETWLARQDRRLVASLQAGAGKAAIANAEKACGVTFPEALRAFYERHDGGGDVTLFDGALFMDLHLVAHRNEMLRSMMAPSGTRVPHLEALASWWTPEYVQFAEDGDVALLVKVDAASGAAGEVVRSDLAEGGHEALAPNFVEWFESYVAAAKSGKIVCLPDADELLSHERAIEFYGEDALSGDASSDAPDDGLDVAARVEQAWDVFETWLRANKPELFATLNPGASDAAIAEAEAALGAALPEAIRAFYRRHDGQHAPDGRPGLLDGCTILSLADIVEQTTEMREIDDGNVASGVSDILASLGVKGDQLAEMMKKGAPLLESSWDPSWVKFTCDDGEYGHVLHLDEHADVDDCAVSFSLGAQGVSNAVSGSFSAWFAKYVAGLETGDVAWVEREKTLRAVEPGELEMLASFDDDEDGDEEDVALNGDEEAFGDVVTNMDELFQKLNAHRGGAKPAEAAAERQPSSAPPPIATPTAGRAAPSAPDDARRVAAALHDFECWLAAKQPRLLADIPHGASDAEIAAAEAAVGVTFPDGVREFYRRMDGLGAFELFYRGGIFSLSEMVESWRMQKELFENDRNSEAYPRAPLSGAKNGWWRLGWIPIAGDGSGDEYILDLDPAEGGAYGQILFHVHDDDGRKLIALSLAEWLEKRIAGIRSGDVVWNAQERAFEGKDDEAEFEDEFDEDDFDEDEDEDY